MGKSNERTEGQKGGGKRGEGREDCFTHLSLSKRKSIRAVLPISAAVGVREVEDQAQFGRKKKERGGKKERRKGEELYRASLAERGGENQKARGQIWYHAVEGKPSGGVNFTHPRKRKRKREES